MIPDKMDFLKAILLCIAAQEEVIELNDADKGFISEILNHDLK